MSDLLSKYDESDPRTKKLQKMYKEMDDLDSFLEKNYNNKKLEDKWEKANDRWHELKSKTYELSGSIDDTSVAKATKDMLRKYGDARLSKVDSDYKRNKKLGTLEWLLDENG